MRYLSGLLAVALLQLGCGTSVYFESESKGETTVKGSLFSSVLGAFPGVAAFANMNVSDSQEFKNQGVGKEDVKSVKLKRLTLKVTAPTDADFSWLSSIKFYAESNGRKELIAQKNGIDGLGLKAPNPQFDLELLDTELKPFVVAPSMSVTTEATGRLPPKDTTLEATVRLGIDAVLIK